MSPKKATPKAAKRPASGQTGFTAEEREAMKDYLRERRAAARPGAATADREAEVLAKIAGMKEPDRTMGKRLHAVIRAAAPGLAPRLWYGMPAYAKDDKVLCYFQGAHKFKARYATLGFSDKANLDEGRLWPVVFALQELTPAEEAKVTALVKRAVR